MRDLVIIGCGGFGREAADVADAINRIEPTWNLLGFVDDDPSTENAIRVSLRGLDLLGPLAAAGPGLRGAHFVVGVGRSQSRAALARTAEKLGMTPATLVHPSAALGANLQVGGGSIICAHVAVGSDVSIGRHVHLDRASQVGHDSQVEDFVTIHPAAVVSGACTVGTAAELGTNSTLLQGMSVGPEAVVAAAACVTKNVPAASVVRGVPAR